jgi:hypothetical protein
MRVQWQEVRGREQVRLLGCRELATLIGYRVARVDPVVVRHNLSSFAKTFFFVFVANSDSFKMFSR